MKWEQFVRATADLLQVYEYAMIRGRALPQHSKGIDRVSTLDAIRSLAYEKRNLRTAPLVACCRELSATDRKDMVYAFLGLAVDGYRGQELNPKYCKTVTDIEVFTDLVRHELYQLKASTLFP